MNANTTHVTLGKGKAVHAGTRTDENGAYAPQPACAGAKAGQYVETTAEVTCKRCLKALADEAAREAAYQDRLAASMSPVTEAHDLGYVHADEPATVADEQPAEVREIREAAEADEDLARRTEDAFRALIADMGPYDDADDDVYEPDEDELNDPLIQRGALAVAGDMTGFTYRDDLHKAIVDWADGTTATHVVDGDLTGFTYRDEDADEVPQAGFCPFGTTAAHGSGCVLWAGHTGAHHVVEGDVDELDELPEVTVTVVDDRRGLIQGPGGRIGELLSVHDGRWSATDENHKFVVLDAASRDLAVRAWAVLMGLGQVVIRNASPDVARVTLKSEQNGSVEFAGRSANVTLIGRMWAVHNEDGTVLAPMRDVLHTAVADWANSLGDYPWAVGVEVTGPAEV